MNDIQSAEEILGINIILYDVGIVDRSIVGEMETAEASQNY